MEVKPRIRKFLTWYECDGDDTCMSGNTIEESYYDWLKAWKNIQRLKEIYRKTQEEHEAKNL